MTPTPHVGLGVDAYIQATSPLRRYPDLVMQRQISHFLTVGEPVYSADDISLVAKRAEVQLRDLSRIEEARRRYWFLKYLMLTRLDAPDEADLFTAYALENEPRRLAALDLDDYPFRVRADLPNSIEPGTTVTLKLTGVDLWRRHAYFPPCATFTSGGGVTAADRLMNALRLPVPEVSPRTPLAAILGISGA